MSSLLYRQFYHKKDEIKDNEMGSVISTNRREENAYSCLVGKREENSLLAKLRVEGWVT
jgi:secreted Zn-dependent insulinase-like peptidase